MQHSVFRTTIAVNGPASERAGTGLEEVHPSRKNSGTGERRHVACEII